MWLKWNLKTEVGELPSHAAYFPADGFVRLVERLFCNRIAKALIAMNYCICSYGRKLEVGAGRRASTGGVA